MGGFEYENIRRTFVTNYQIHNQNMLSATESSIPTSAVEHTMGCNTGQRNYADESKRANSLEKIV